MSLQKKHLRHCLLFTYQLNKNAAEAKQMICSVLGENVVSYSTCKKWFQRFKNGNFDLNDEERQGQPKKVDDIELENLLEENPFCTPSQLAEKLGVTRQAISKRLHQLGKIRKRTSDPSHDSAIDNKKKRSKKDVNRQELEKSHLI